MWCAPLKYMLLIVTCTLKIGLLLKVKYAACLHTFYLFTFQFCECQCLRSDVFQHTHENARDDVSWLPTSPGHRDDASNNAHANDASGESISHDFLIKMFCFCNFCKIKHRENSYIKFRHRHDLVIFEYIIVRFHNW